MVKTINIRGEQPLVDMTPRASSCGVAQSPRKVTSSPCGFERRNMVLSYKAELCVAREGSDVTPTRRKKRKAPKLPRQHKYASIYRAKAPAQSLLVVDTTPETRLIRAH